MDVSGIHNIPGYVEILRYVLKTQIQNLVEQLRDHGGEETLVLSANLTAGTISHLGSDKGQGFLDVRDDIRSHFLTHCLQGNKKYHTAHQPANAPVSYRNLPGVSRKDSSTGSQMPSNKTGSSPPKQFDVCSGHSPGIKPVSLSTIDQAAIQNMIHLPIDTQILPHVSDVTEISVSQAISHTYSLGLKTHTPTLQSVPVPATSSSVKMSPKHVLPETMSDPKLVTSIDPSLLNIKLLTDSNLIQAHRDTGTCPRLISDITLPIPTVCDVREPTVAMSTKPKENISKTTKRKQKRRGEPITSLPVNTDIMTSEILGKKAKVYESILPQDSVITVVQKTACSVATVSHQETSTVSLLDESRKSTLASDSSSVGNISLLNMQPVLLLNETNMGNLGPQNVFIESALQGHPIKKPVTDSAKSSTVDLSGMTSLIGASKCIGNIDPKEKDKTKKTLSSKIDEITQRITKDDTIKQHTVHTKMSEFSSNAAGSPVYSNSSANQSGVTDCGDVNSISLGNQSEFPGSATSINSPDNSAASSIEQLHDSDGKCKDGSRASHRKPKLPRFNIGVASDDEENGDGSRCSSPHTPAAMLNTMVTTPTSVGISHDDAQDIINIQVSNDDSETSFPHINLEELADGLLLTDIPMVSYYNNVDESSRSLIESVFNLKPGRDPSTKKPLNSQSVIVCGSKQEKDWVKCPLCPDKFLTAEALQFHIKNVNHAVKRFECDLCGRKFGQLRDMERHRRIHTGERPFTCDVCRKSFSRKDNLKSHRKKHPINIEITQQ